MPSMNYCVFRNTASDLKDCIEMMKNDEIDSDQEWYAMESMVTLCEQFMEASRRTTRKESDEDEDC